MKELTAKIESLRTRFDDAKRILDIDKKNIELANLEAKTTEEDFWADRSLAEEVMKEVGKLKKFLLPWQDLENEIIELRDLINIIDPGDHKELGELEVKTSELEKRFEDMEFSLMFSGTYDSEDAIVSIYSGAGGTDAQDWAEMLLKMISKFAQSRALETEVLHISSGEEAGIKSATLKVSGLFAYGTLRSENGVHRLVRISPFDADHARHTSFALVEVLPYFDKVPEIEIRPEELKIDTFRASGAGGQHVNTTDSAVRITHLPTGVVVSVQNERSQHQNKEMAMKILKTKLYKLMQEKRAKELSDLKGDAVKVEWGSQIRSYVLHPYTKVKDHRTDYEEGDTQKVLDGGLDKFVEAYLKMHNK